MRKLGAPKALNDDSNYYFFPQGGLQKFHTCKIVALYLKAQSSLESRTHGIILTCCLYMVIT